MMHGYRWLEEPAEDPHVTRLRAALVKYGECLDDLCTLCDATTTGSVEESVRAAGEGVALLLEAVESLRAAGTVSFDADVEAIRANQTRIEAAREAIATLRERRPWAGRFWEESDALVESVVRVATELYNEIEDFYPHPNSKRNRGLDIT